MLKQFFAYFSLLFVSINLYSIDEYQSAEFTYLIKDSSDVSRFFPKTVDEIASRFESIKSCTKDVVDKIIAIPVHERTYENTILALDKTMANFDIFGSLMGLVKLTHPSEEMRKKAEDISSSCADIEINLFQTNKDLYHTCKEYQANTQELLNEERLYYLTNLINGFEAAGLELEGEQFTRLKELHKKIADLSIEFQKNIAQDNSKVCFKPEELIGAEESFIKNLPKNDEGLVLSCDYPTSFQVMTGCQLESTREKFYQAFRSRGFPKNIEVLNQIINTRDELAKLLSYQSYADLDIAFTMAETVDTVENLLSNVYSDAKEDIKKSWYQLMNNLPESVSLTSEGKLKPWDLTHSLNHYLKKNLQVDQNKIAEYFPMETTIQGLLAIYEKFFDFEFVVIKSDNFWDPSVQFIEVKNKETNTILGYILVDLFPRDNKFSHAACFQVIPPISYDNGKTHAPAVAVVVANFSKSTAEKPSLLKHGEVNTFFHEFGHAIHVLSGKSEMPSRGGYNTKFDFLETPSQLLEEWIWDYEILKNLSHHYKTGESLPDDVLEKLIKSREFKEGIGIEAQLSYAELSLRLYQEGQNKNFSQIKKDVYSKIENPIAYDDAVNGLCSFDHLSSYGPKYYTYLWSEQLAKKIFNHIKAHGGLLDPVMGKRYISKIIGRGGSCHPNKMIEDFLNDDAQAVS